MTDLTPPTFGTLLRLWRKDRRLSQEALALAASTPPRHVSHLETGRAKPSRQMIDRLAGVLTLPLAERAQLTRAAGFVPDQDAAPPNDPLLADATARLLSAHDPCPAFAMDRSWSVTGTNAAADRMLAPFGADQPHNLLDLVFSPQGMRPLITNWPAYARHTIQRIHREAATSRDLEAALARVTRHPDVPQDWWGFDITADPGPIFRVEMNRGDVTATFYSVLSTIAVPTHPAAQDLRIETLLPADSATDVLLNALAEAA